MPLEFRFGVLPIPFDVTAGRWTLETLPSLRTTVAAWKKRIGNLPLVAIGGITPGRADGVVKAGADSLAVITDFFTHPDPVARVRQWVAWAERVKG